MSYVSTKNEAAQLFSQLIIIIINVSWVANQHIWMISEGPCDTEDLSNDAENVANLLYKYFTILQFLLYF